jgi:predicted nucleic acid-binding Zn ribbon protein
MHEMFNFPIRCEFGQLIPESVDYMEKEDGVYLIYEGRISELLGLVENLRSYNPFDKPDLIPSIIKLVDKVKSGGNKLNLITKWVLTWGLLESNYVIEGNKIYFMEKLDNFWMNINKIYILWDLYKGIVNRDLNKLHEYITISEVDNSKETYVVHFFKEESFGYKESRRIIRDVDPYSFKSYQSAGFSFIVNSIEQHVRNCTIFLNRSVLNHGTQEDSIELTPAITVNSLLDAIYMQFFILLTKNDKKICPVCHTPFFPAKKDKIYCSTSCKLTAKSRRYRQRKHNKESLKSMVFPS